MNTTPSTPSTPSTPADAPKASLASDAGHPLDDIVLAWDMLEYLTDKGHFASAGYLVAAVESPMTRLSLAQTGKEGSIVLIAKFNAVKHTLAEIIVRAQSEDAAEGIAEEESVSVISRHVFGVGLTPYAILNIASYWIPSFAVIAGAFAAREAYDDTKKNGGTAQ